MGETPYSVRVLLDSSLARSLGEPRFDQTYRRYEVFPRRVSGKTS